MEQTIYLTKHIHLLQTFSKVYRPSQVSTDRLEEGLQTAPQVPAEGKQGQHMCRSRYQSRYWSCSVVIRQTNTFHVYKVLLSAPPTNALRLT